MLNFLPVVSATAASAYFVARRTNCGRLVLSSLNRFFGRPPAGVRFFLDTSRSSFFVADRDFFVARPARFAAVESAACDELESRRFGFSFDVLMSKCPRQI